jgi:hypothetical protein
MFCGPVLAGTITVRTVTVRTVTVRTAVTNKKRFDGPGTGNPARFCAEAMSFCHIQSVADDLVF